MKDLENENFKHLKVNTIELGWSGRLHSYPKCGTDMGIWQTAQQEAKGHDAS
jgi:hypothetical protein